ncbi:MAG: FISUMP domain-containing protein [Rikenellaceae bacterium]
MKKNYLAMLFIAAALVACTETDDAGDDAGDDTGSENFTESTDSFTYYGETYKTVTLSNGSKWMAEPLRYVPEGFTPSDDATDNDAHIWYPYEIDYAQLVADEKVSSAPGIDYVTVLTDDASIAAKGYLYDITAAMGGVEITDENFESFEGAQGICPEGWHIPTRADYFALVGYSNKAVGEESAPDDSTAILYDSAYKGGTIPAFESAGLNYVYAGARFFGGYLSSTVPYYMRSMICSTNTTNEALYGNLSMSYYMTSTAYQASYSTAEATLGQLSNIQFFGLMSTFTTTYPEGRLTLSYVAAGTGQSIRCVKDSE